MELEVGYGFPIYVRDPPGSGNLFETAQYFPSEGFSVLFGPKIYRLNNKYPGFYLEPYVIFKDLKYLNVYFPSDYANKPNSEYYPVGDKYTLVYGMTLRIGTVRKYGIVIVDYYAGIGFKVKDYTYFFYRYYDHYDSKTVYYFADHSPVIQKDTEIQPVINLGIKLGFGF